MPVPARRKTGSSARRRRSHDALKPVSTGICSACNLPTIPHHACPTCGTYGSKTVKE